MKVDSQMVKHMASLAMLKIEDQDIEVYRKHLDKVLDHMQELNKINTDNIEPMTNPIRELKQKYKSREDKVEASLPTEQVLKNAPDSKLNQFKVEAVIE